MALFAMLSVVKSAMLFWKKKISFPKKNQKIRSYKVVTKITSRAATALNKSILKGHVNAREMSGKHEMKY